MVLGAPMRRPPAGWDIRNPQQSVSRESCKSSVLAVLAELAVLTVLTVLRIQAAFYHGLILVKPQFPQCLYN
jgi:hypothetical protein